MLTPSYPFQKQDCANMSQSDDTHDAGSLSGSMRAVTSDRGARVSGGGMAIADIVNDEMRPMLKSWLDANLPGIVEKIVRGEIERVTQHI